MLESKIKSRIKEKLTEKGWFVTTLIQTTTNGIPDILALKNKRTVFIEGKQPGKELKPDEDYTLQDYRIDQLRKQGFEVIVATALKDIQHLL